MKRIRKHEQTKLFILTVSKEMPFFSIAVTKLENEICFDLNKAKRVFVHYVGKTNAYLNIDHFW